MTTVDGLLLLVAIVYLVECAAWLRRDAVVFRQGFGRRWRHRPLTEWGGHDRNSFTLSGPLPPLPPLIVTQFWPLSISSEGILSFAASSAPGSKRPPHEGRFLPWSEVGEVRIDGKAVRVGGELFAVFISPLLADRVGGLLEDLKEMAAKSRDAGLRDAIRASLDLEAARRRLGEWREEAGPLAFSANLLLLYLFGVVPAAFHLPHLAQRWPLVLVSLFLVWWLVLYEFTRSHKRLYPDAKSERRRHFWMMLFSPLAALRARDIVTRDSFCQFHPLAVARLLLREKDFAGLARDLLADARYPLPPLPDHPSELSYRALLLAETERFLRHEKVDPETLLAPPPREGEGSRSYCERCRAQYRVESGLCETCGGRPLTPFAPAGAAQE